MKPIQEKSAPDTQASSNGPPGDGAVTVGLGSGFPVTDAQWLACVKQMLNQDEKVVWFGRPARGCIKPYVWGFVQTLVVMAVATLLLPDLGIWWGVYLLFWCVASSFLAWGLIGAYAVTDRRAIVLRAGPTPYAQCFFAKDLIPPTSEKLRDGTYQILISRESYTDDLWRRVRPVYFLVDGPPEPILSSLRLVLEDSTRTAPPAARAPESIGDTHA